MDLENPTGVAGNDLATALKDTMIADSKVSARKVAKAATLTAVLGEPTFELKANPKMFPDEKDPSKASGEVARAYFNFAGTGYVFYVKITRREQSGKDDQGAFADVWHDASIIASGKFGSGGPVLSAPKDRPELGIMLSVWLTQIRDKYESWRDTIDAAMPTQKSSLAPRHVKRIRPTA